MMTAAMSRLTIGSSHVQPVCRITKPATTTPAETTASLSMCAKAARTLRSPPAVEPRANSHAVTPLTTIPAAATAMTVTPATGCGSAKRWTASHATAPTATSNITALNSAARIDELRMP